MLSRIRSFVSSSPSSSSEDDCDGDSNSNGSNVSDCVCKQDRIDRNDNDNNADHIERTNGNVADLVDICDSESECDSDDGEYKEDQDDESSDGSEMSFTDCIARFHYVRDDDEDDKDGSSPSVFARMIRSIDSYCSIFDYPATIAEYRRKVYTLYAFAQMINIIKDILIEDDAHRFTQNSLVSLFACVAYPIVFPITQAACIGWILPLEISRLRSRIVFAFGV